jgi:hypothetical protein
MHKCYFWYFSIKNKITHLNLEAFLMYISRTAKGQYMCGVCCLRAQTTPIKNHL